MRGRSLELPSGCYLEHGGEALILRHPDGSVVGKLCNEDSDHAQNGTPRNGTPTFRARFLGDFELLRGVEPVDLGRNARAAAILKYLLAHRPRPASQDFLMCWLWPESNLKRARWSLNSAIYALRKVLGIHLPAIPASDTVLFEKGAYRLSPRVRVSTDAAEFDARCEEGFRLEKDGRISGADEEYEAAVALYRGDYLVGDLYEDWTHIERERLVDSYTEVLGKLAAHRMERGEYREAVECCYRILEKDRCSEDAHRMLMACFARLGRRARAVRQYRMCERTLGREWDMEPSPETRALYSGILDGKSAAFG